MLNNRHCVSLMENLGGGIAEYHTLGAVSKSQPLKHNGKRALTPAVHCKIRPAITVVCTSIEYFQVFKYEYSSIFLSLGNGSSSKPICGFVDLLFRQILNFGETRHTL